MTTSADAPSHLRGHVVPLEAHLAGARRFELRSTAGGALFEVRYSGELWAEYNLIVDAGGVPALVVAVAQDTGEQVVLFDGARHGRANRAGSARALSGQARTPVELYASPVGATVFRLIVEVHDDAASTDADDFVALSVGGVDEDGDRYWFVEEDLA